MRLGSRLRNWWGGSLQRRLLLSNVVTAVFFLLILGLVALSTGAANLKRQVEEGHRRLAVLVAKDIEAQYGNTVKTVEFLHRQLEAAANFPSVQARAMRDLRLALPLTYRALYLFNATGDPLVSVAGPVEELDTSSVEEIIAPLPAQVPDNILGAYRQTGAGGMFTSPVQIIDADQVPVLCLGISLAGEDGQVLVVEIDLRSVWQRVDEVYAGQTGRALVVSRDGVIIAHPDRAYIGEPPPPPLRPVLDGYEGETTYTDPLSGRVMLAAYSPAGKQSGWGIVVEQEHTRALAPLKTTALATLGTLLVAAGMATVVTILVAQSITRPILRLAKATRTIAHTGDLSQNVTVERADEVGQLAAMLNQMMDGLRRAEERTQRLLNQQIAVNQLALALEKTRDLDNIYQTIYEHIQALVDTWGFIVSFYDDETQLIRAKYAMYKGVNVDVTEFPPIPLAEPGRGTQSRVIHTGEPLYTPDHRKALETSRTEYLVEENGTVKEGPPPKEEEDIARSALYVPLKVAGKIIGLIQIQSPRLDAYTQEDIDISAAMANVAAGAVQNVRLYDAVQQELAVRVQAEEALREHQEHLEKLVAQRTTELNERVAEVEQLNRGMVNLLEDLQAAKSNLEATAAKLREVNQELNDFAYVVSHDLKAPLRAITQLAGWIATDYADALDEDGREMINLLIGRAKRMHNLIEGILQYSRIGRIQEKERNVELNLLVQETIEMLAPPDNVQITVADELPTVVGERTRLGQVFQNLLDNAIKYMDKPEGQINVGCVDKGTRWLFSVADNGPGIEETYYDNIFQMFQTLAPRDEIESTGVGLALVKRIVETSGGKVWVESTVGKGSTFYFTLPKKGGQGEKH